MTPEQIEGLSSVVNGVMKVGAMLVIGYAFFRAWQTKGPRNLPCPQSGAPNKLTAEEKGFQCLDCAMVEQKR